MASQHLQAEADSSSSDDEQQPAPREYLPAAHGIARGHSITGELLKQSVNNPDLWRRRQCFVVADKMWCLKPPKSSVAPWTRRRSTLISLAHSHASEGSGPSAANPKRRHAIELQTTDRVWRFQAASRDEQKRWIKALRESAQHASDNDLIRIADHIICDEESAQCRRAAALAAQQQQQSSQAETPPSQAPGGARRSGT